MGSWFPGLVHSALALALASIALALGVLAVQPVAGHSFTFSASLKRSLNLSANKYYYYMGAEGVWGASRGKFCDKV